MKKIGLLFIALQLCVQVIAQIHYESPLVSNGKSFQIEIPEGYYPINSGMATHQMTVFSTDSTFEYIKMLINDTLDSQILTLTYSDSLSSLEEYIKMHEAGLLEKKCVILDEGKIQTINGHEFYTNAIFFPESIGSIELTSHVAFTAFEGFCFGINYTEENPNNKFKKMETVMKILNSFEEIETDREDKLNLDEDLFLDELIHQPNSISTELETMRQELRATFDSLFPGSEWYDNELFETKLDSYDFLPDYGDHWGNPEDEDSRFLNVFCFDDSLGSIYAFSVGEIDPSNAELTPEFAITKVFDLTGPLELEFIEDVNGENHSFKRYTISGGDKLVAFYTTVMRRELVFFVVEEGSSPNQNFMDAFPLFMDIMYVSIF